MDKKRRAIIIVLCVVLLAAAVTSVTAAVSGRTRATAEAPPGFGTNEAYAYYSRIYDVMLGGNDFDRAFFYSFGALYLRSDVVAIVTPLDDLTAEASYGTRRSNDGSAIYTFVNIDETIHSYREVKAVKYFKNDLELGETFTMYDECALSAEGALAANEHDYPMLRGSYYLVCLYRWGGHNISVVSGYQAKMDLTHLTFNYDRKMTRAALYGLDLAEEKGGKLTTEYTKRAYRLPLDSGQTYPLPPNLQ